LPESIRLSTILTGNHLGQLGNLEKLPDNQEIELIIKDPLIAILLDELRDDQYLLEEELHMIAKDWIDEGRVKDALAALMIIPQK
jgi:hypothetical protein